MSRDVLIAIGGGLFSAVAVAAIYGGSAFGAMFVYFAIVPLLLVGLSLGPRAAVLAAGTGICAIGIFGGLLAAAVFGMVQALPAWVITRLTILGSTSGGTSLAPSEPVESSEEKDHTHWQSPGLALSVLSLLGGAFILIASLTAGDAGLKGQVNLYLGQIFQIMMPQMGPEAKDITVSRLSAFFPGAIGAIWIIMVVINGVIAQSILAKTSQNLRPTPAYAKLDLPQWLSWPLIVAAATALGGSVIGAEELSYIAYNVTMVFAVPYFFLGLAVIHSLARRIAQTRAVLIGMYVVLIVQIWAAVVVCGVGVVEQWFGLRDRQNESDDEDGQSPVE